MKRFGIHRFFPALAAITLLAAPVFAQDSLTTLQGLRVDGRIISEDEDQVFINTRYGELRFLKMDLKTVKRGGGGGAPPRGGGMSLNPFGGPQGGSAQDAPAAAGTNPFAPGAPAPPPASNTNPFATDTSAPPPPAPSAGTNPFAPQQPAETPVPSEGANPFAEPASAAGSPPAAAPKPPGTIARGFGGFGTPVDETGTPPAAPPASAPANASAGNPFAPPKSNPTDSPMTGMIQQAPPGGSANPFAPVEQQPSPSGANPFAAPDSVQPVNPFAPLPEPQTSIPRDPYSNYDAGADEDPAEALATQATADETPKPRRIPVFQPRKELPVVQAGYDAVVFGMTREIPVQIKHPSAEWAAATDDTQLESGSEVRTEEAATSRMLLRNKKDEIRLPEKSHIEIEKLSADSEEVVINLKSGSVWTEVEPRSKPDAFQVRTPELTAGVRGTIFRVDRAAGASKVSVFEGVVHVVANGTGASVTLKENQAAVVNLHGQIMELLAVPVDEQKIAADWDEWSQQASGGSGSLAGSFGPVAGLSQQIATDNAAWEAEMQQYARNVAEVRFQEKLDEYAAAFMRFAADTGHIPSDEEGWSALKFDTGMAGWSGPYVEGPIPPLDPFKQPLVYKKVQNPTGRVYGRVYSLWEDRRDQGGVNATSDRIAIVKFFELERFADDPAVNPR